VRTLAAFLVFTACAPAQTVDQLRAVISGTTQFRETEVSPDGHWLSWTVTLRNKDNTESKHSEIWLLDLTSPGAQARKVTSSKTPRSEHSVAFSPDSSQMAFLSDAEKSQLEINPVAGDEVEKLVKEVYQTPKPLADKAADFIRH